MCQTYSTAIKENTQFQASDQIEICYKFQEPEYIILEDRYHLSEIAGSNDLQKALNLLAWLNSHIRHRGNYYASDTQDALTLLELAFDKDTGINCFAMSIILCECLLAVSVKSRVMYMMPQSIEDGDNHIVVEAFISDLHKWIMLDPTYGSYCMNTKGEIINLYEMRACVARGEKYLFSDTINYNGEKIDNLDDIRAYYAKNLFFFRCKSIQGYGQHRDYENIIEIAPVGFDVHNRMVENLKFRMENYGSNELFQSWKQFEENLNNKYISIESIY